MTEFTTEDIRSSVQAGIVTETQAASLMAHMQSRQGYRDQMTQDDEPFEFFKGFAEIFVTLGLGLLLWGLFGVLWLLGSFAIACVGVSVASILAARYYTLKRRMTLPSIALAIAVIFPLSSIIVDLMVDGALKSSTPVLISSGIAVLASLGYFVYFRLPFAMFLFGVNLLFALYALVGQNVEFYMLFNGGVQTLFDLRTGSSLAFVSLIYGFAMMALGLWFDMKDPHRISRYSVTGFWLHILAAPALVNTAAMTAYNIGGVVGIGWTALLLLVVTLFAIVIDRRSFLTAGLFYFIAVLTWAMTNSLGDMNGSVAIIFVVGAIFTAIGTWWVQIRSDLMTRLPDFPGKSKLPPINDPRFT